MAVLLAPTVYPITLRVNPLLITSSFCSISDQVIYPGKVLNADCFRIGNIGHLLAEDMRHLLVCIEEVCKEMNMNVPVS